MQTPYPHRGGGNRTLNPGVQHRLDSEIFFYLWTSLCPSHSKGMSSQIYSCTQVWISGWFLRNIELLVVRCFFADLDEWFVLKGETHLQLPSRHLGGWHLTGFPPLWWKPQFWLKRSSSEARCTMGPEFIWLCVLFVFVFFVFFYMKPTFWDDGNVITFGIGLTRTTTHLTTWFRVIGLSLDGFLWESASV